LNKVLMA